jgi:hypothetical protein
MCTDSSADIGKRVGFIHLPAGFGNIIPPDGIDIFRNIHPCRTGGCTEATGHAAAGFQLSLLFCESFYDFHKRRITLFRLKFLHGNPLQIQKVYILVRLPAFGEALIVNTLFIRKHEKGIEFVVNMSVFLSHVQGIGGTYVHTESTPAATSVVYNRPVFCFPQFRFPAFHRYHTYRIVITYLGTGAASYTLVKIVDMKTPISVACFPILRRHMYGVRFFTQGFQG